MTCNKGVHKIVNLKGMKRNSDVLLGYGCTWTFAKVSTSTYSLQVMISSKVEALGLVFHFCIANHFFSLSDQKFLRHRKSCVLLLLYWKITTFETYRIIINCWSSSTNCAKTNNVILLFSINNSLAHCWWGQWKGCCFSWGSPWQHTDWSEAHGCQQVVQQR